MQAKYQKFVYSNQFGFSVQRGSGLEDGAFDNTLAVTAADEHAWHMRNGEGRYEVTAQYIMMEYRLVRGVAVETVIVPLKKGHVRIHFIQADIEAEYADGGFAIRTEREGQEMMPEMTCTAGGRACCVFPWGTAGAVCLKGAGGGAYCESFPQYQSYVWEHGHTDGLLSHGRRDILDRGLLLWRRSKQRYYK